jgi:ribulose-phosphate 3-epimerase
MKLKLGIAINPETPLTQITPYAGGIDYFLIMFVHPGFSNQKYIPEVEQKLRDLRAMQPAADIEVDGGISKETALRAKAAGANIFAAASAIFGRDSIKEAIADIYLSIS